MSTIDQLKTDVLTTEPYTEYNGSILTAVHHNMEINKYIYLSDRLYISSSISTLT